MKKMFYLTLLIIPLFSCEKRGTEQTPLEFEVVTLDSQGNPTNTFNVGEDPIFAFRISNTSKKDIVWYSHCELFNQPELYDTYKIINDDSGEKNIMYVGKPFESPVNCEDTPLLIKPQKSYYFKLPWSFNPNNEQLPKGNYITEFALSFTVADQTISQSFSKEFKIQ